MLACRQHYVRHLDGGQISSLRLPLSVAIKKEIATGVIRQDGQDSVPCGDGRREHCVSQALPLNYGGQLVTQRGPVEEAIGKSKSAAGFATRLAGTDQSRLGPDGKTATEAETVYTPEVVVPGQLTLMLAPVPVVYHTSWSDAFLTLTRQSDAGERTAETWGLLARGYLRRSYIVSTDLVLGCDRDSIGVTGGAIVVYGCGP